MPAATQTLLDDAAVDIDQWIAEEVETRLRRAGGHRLRHRRRHQQAEGLPRLHQGRRGVLELGQARLSSRPASPAPSPASNPSDKLIDLVYALKAGYRQNAAFVMNRKTQSADPQAQGRRRQLSLAPPADAPASRATLMGFPVVEAEDMPDIAANALVDRLRRFPARLSRRRPGRRARAARSLFGQALRAVLHDQARRRRRAGLRRDQAAEVRGRLTGASARLTVADRVARVRRDGRRREAARRSWLRASAPSAIQRDMLGDRRHRGEAAAGGRRRRGERAARPAHDAEEPVAAGSAAQDRPAGIAPAGAGAGRLGEALPVRHDEDPVHDLHRAERHERGSARRVRAVRLRPSATTPKPARITLSPLPTRRRPRGSSGAKSGPSGPLELQDREVDAGLGARRRAGHEGRMHRRRDRPHRAAGTAVDPDDPVGRPLGDAMGGGEHEVRRMSAPEQNSPRELSTRTTDSRSPFGSRTTLPFTTASAERRETRRKGRELSGRA